MATNAAEIRLGAGLKWFIDSQGVDEPTPHLTCHVPICQLRPRFNVLTRILMFHLKFGKRRIGRHAHGEVGGDEHTLSSTMLKRRLSSRPAASKVKVECLRRRYRNCTELKHVPRVPRKPSLLSSGDLLRDEVADRSRTVRAAQVGGCFALA